MDTKRIAGPGIYKTPKLRHILSRFHKLQRLFYIGLLWLLAFNTPAGILVQFRTTANYIDPTTSGNIDVELFEDKPVTVQNFLRYVKSGYYQNMFLHRCIPGFIVQGGGYGVINPFSPNRFSTNDHNVFSFPSFGPITNEFNVGRRLTNSFGTIAMCERSSRSETVPLRMTLIELKVSFSNVGLKRAKIEALLSMPFWEMIFRTSR